MTDDDGGDKKLRFLDDVICERPLIENTKCPTCSVITEYFQIRYNQA